MMIPIRQTMSRADWSLLVVLSTLWGGSFFFIAIAAKDLPPLTIVALRVGIAALILFALLGLGGKSLPASWRVWRVLLGMGVINSVLPFSLIAWGQTQVPSGLAAVFNATTPFWTALVVQFLTADEKLSAGKIAGILLGVAGVCVLIGPRAFLDFGAHGWGELAILAGALSNGFAGALGRNIARLRVEPIVAAAGQMAMATMLMIPLALLVDQPWQLAMPGWQTWASVFGIAALSTVLAFLIFYRLLARAGATNTSLVTLLVPVSAILLGTLVLGERLEPQHIAGMALIAAGLVAIDGRAWRRVRGRRAAEA